MKPDNEAYTFHRIPARTRWHYPSWNYRELEPYVKEGGTIQIQIRYLDIKGNSYSLPEEEQEIILKAE